MSKKTKKGIPGPPRYYETVVVIDSLIGDDAIKTIVEKIKDVITQKQAKIVKLEEWGKKKLAYPIKKKTYGYYVSVEFEGPGDVNAALLEYYRITESILRHIITLVDSRLQKERLREKAPMKEIQTEEVAQLNI